MKNLSVQRRAGRGLASQKLIALMCNLLRRERHQQAELQRLQAQVSVLLSEREQLHQQHLLAGKIVSVLTDAECQTDRIVAPDADAVGNARREAARRETGKQLQWRQPQLL